MYDVIVIGGGPGGYVAAIKAALAGKKTAIVERERLGGVCLNWGCIPTKSLLRNAEMIRGLTQGDKFGFSVEGVSADYAKAHARSRAVSEKLVRGIEYLMKKNNIMVYRDTARLTGKNTLELTGSGEVLQCSNVIVATGGTFTKLPMLDDTQPNILDAKGALALTQAPESIVIVGGGAIGVEFATVFAAYGTKVTLIEMMERILPNEEAEVSALVQKEMQGIEVLTGARLMQVKHSGKRIEVELECGGRRTRIEATHLLAAAGIRPNTKGLGLEQAGVALDERGYIKVDEAMCTNVTGIYAIGDVTGKLALAHTASAQAMRAVDHICGRRIQPIAYRDIPKCTYCVPEVASAGLTEAQAEKCGMDVGVAVFPLSANGKAIAYGEEAGFVKLIYEKKYGQLLGASMVGAHVTEMIWGIVGYLGLEMTVDEMAKVVHPHPTMSEAILEAAHIASGQPIHI